MNNKLIRKLFLLISFFVLLHYLPSCDSCYCPDEEIKTEDQIFVNGCLTPLSRTQVQGNMFITNKNGIPIPFINTSNLIVRLRWNTQRDSVTGIVTMTQYTRNIAAALTMDYSASMSATHIQCMENGVHSYINSMRVADLTEIIKFSAIVYVVQPFTSNTLLLHQIVDTTVIPRNSTALYQSIKQGLLDAGVLSSSQYLRTIVAFTDGADNNSGSVTRDSVINHANGLCIPVFTVTLGDSLSSGATNMRIIANSTGGFPFLVDPNNCGSLPAVYQQINNQLNNAYSVTIAWPSAGLPPAGTTVTAVVYVTYQGFTAMFERTYNIP